MAWSAAEDAARAKESLLELYYLLFDLTEGYRFSGEQERVITNIFLEYPEMKKLDKQELLFQQPALEMYEKFLNS